MVQNRNTALGALKNLRMRLLDLTARNRLINFRHTKRGSLRIIDELPDQLAETLLTETEMSFLPVPEPSRDDLIDAGYIKIDEETDQEIRLKKDPTAEEWAQHIGLATSYEVPKQLGDARESKHKDLAIQTILYPYELEARLKGLLQTAESAIQEMGANILYLAFGFLEWFDSTNDNSRYAPLYLVPVRLHKGRLNPKTKTYQYTLAYSGEDIIPNLSLREKLRTDFGIALPALDENTNPEAYFDDVLAAIQDNQPRWKLRRYTSLALLNFSKLLMYLDLDPENWPENKNIIDHPIIGDFLIGYDAQQNETDDNSPGDLGFGEEYIIDIMDDIHTKYPLINDADSSQHSALIDAVDGKNLVIEGPPGTGKSQTITNLIAATLSQGKKVLFVAEKLAALEVVRKRLDSAGIGNFCLELHSHKSQKRKVIDEIQERINKHRKYRKPKDIDIEITRYEELKTKLKNYVERVNQPWKNTERTLHEIFTAATRYRESVSINPDAIHPDIFNGDNFDGATQKRTKDQVEIFRKVYEGVTSQLDEDLALQDHPWYGVKNTDLQLFDIEQVTTALSNWSKSLQKLSDEKLNIANTLNCDPNDISGSLETILSLSNDLEQIPKLNGNEILDKLPKLREPMLEKIEKYLKFFESIQSMYQRLSEKISLDILNNLSEVDKLLAGINKINQLSRPETNLSTLSDGLKRLTKIQEQLIVLKTPFIEINDALGQEAAKHLQTTESGLNQFKILFDLVIKLNPSYWKLRDDLFDNDELDEILPELRTDLHKLNSLHSEIQPSFNLDTLPTKTELDELQQILKSGGTFRWFKSEWRNARKKLLSYSAGKHIKYPTLELLVGKAAEYIDLLKNFNSNQDYKIAFGTYLSGLDTDIDALETLRSWYKDIRHEYGVGFGKRVSIGNAIINLPQDVARKIRSYSSQGIELIDDITENLKIAKKIFEPVPEIKDITTSLIGEGSAINHLTYSLDAGLRECESIITDETISITELSHRIESLNNLKQSVEKWNNADIDNKLFDKKLGLRLGVEIDNSAGLSILRNSLSIANHLERKIKNDVVKKYIYEQPTISTFSTLSSLYDQLKQSIGDYTITYREFFQLTKIDMNSWTNRTGDELNGILAKNELALNNPNTLQNWLDYARVREQLVSIGLVRLVENIECGAIGIHDAENAYQSGVFDLLAREILRERPELGQFSGQSHNAIQDKFREYDERLKDLQCKKIAWKIDQSDVPKGYHGARVRDRTELYLLEHECSKKAKHLPIRQLLHRASEALISLKPCFMMGPMSVAQYLPPGKIHFDLVIMDEASQIKPQDALGAIARGSQFVVVGDPKQLPPTSFFDRVIDDRDDDSTAIEESESILDATLPMFPARRLRWHYRSQHETLIAFSNQSFYDSDLVLFPSPHKATDEYGIKYFRVRRGCFVNRRNMEEAKVIAEATREHYRQRPNESLGIVAMSAEQRQQIESSIETLTKEDSIFREHLEINAGKTESLFIKNLENVQGDERDVIYISMTYGPKEINGKVFQRFGPINSDVGWRRLNVLFTRSKKRMHVFSSMGSEDIVADSSAKLGVQALRNFLSFCETGILHHTERDSNRPPDSDFEIAVAESLRQEGYECVPQVGVAGFFIDIAVLDPGNPGRYLMGIECDGATYHSAKSVRDRDRLRQMILERLGWNIRRIWSTDWFKNPNAELKPILKELALLKTEKIEVFGKKPELEVIENEEAKAKDIKTQPISINELVLEESGLKERLVEFDQKVIRKSLPNTPDNQRILRPAMLEAFLEYLPLSKTEFLEYMPQYLRHSTNATEGQFLDDILGIINAGAEELIAETA